MMNKYSIGICTYNRSDILKETLKSIVKYIPHDNIEIIIVDNNSKDDTGSIVDEFIANNKNYDTTYILELNQGLSFARNKVIDSAKYENILFLDDDAVLVSNLTCEYDKAIDEYPNCYILGGKVIPQLNIEYPTWFKKEFYMLYSILDEGNEIKQFPPKLGPIGANFLVKKSYIGSVRFRTDLGRIGNILLSGEETDFLIKIGFNSSNSCYVGTAVVSHYFPVSRYSKTWALERFKQNGISNRKLKESYSSLLYGFLSEGYQLLKAMKTMNYFYIQCRLVSIINYVR